MQAQISSTIRRYSDAKLAKELAFAEMAVDENDPATIEWLEALQAEKERRNG